MPRLAPGRIKTGIHTGVCRSWPTKLPRSEVSHGHSVKRAHPRDGPHDNRSRLAFPSTTWTTGIRDAKTARKMLEILEKHRWVFGIEGGMQLDGAHRNEVWKIVGKETKP